VTTGSFKFFGPADLHDSHGLIHVLNLDCFRVDAGFVGGQVLHLLREAVLIHKATAFADVGSD
jgi:hypothetical protein